MLTGYASESPGPHSPCSTSGGRWELLEEGESGPTLSPVKVPESSDERN